MNKIALNLMLAVLGLLLAGCMITSVFPFFTEKDLVFEPGLLGTWAAEEDDPDTWTFGQAEELGYRLIIREDGATNVFEAHLFKLGEHRFLDLLTTARHEYSIPVHFLLRVETIKPFMVTADRPKLVLLPLNPEWMGEWLEAHPDSIRHHWIKNPDTNEKELPVLTAETAALQAFLLAHLAEEKFFTDPVELVKSDGSPSTGAPE